MVRLLVVEDDEAIRECMIELLETEGFTVYATGKGEEALDLMRFHRWEAVLLDMSLPDMAGEAVLETLRAEGRLESLPLVAMSATPKRVEQAQRDGLLGLNKPFEITELSEVIASCLKIKQIPMPHGRQETEEQSDLRYEAR